MSLILPKKEFWSDANQSEVLEICRPILSKYKIRTISYARVFNDRTYYSFHSDLRCAEYGYKNNIHITAHVSPSIVNERFWHVPPKSGAYSQVYKDYGDIFQVKSVADFTIRKKGYFDTFCFGASIETEELFNLFLSSREKLEQFSYLFLGNIRPIARIASEDRLILTPARLPNFKGLEHGEISFSKREQECLHFLGLGLTSKEIALKMGLSHRTIEFYLENIKNKLGCFKKSEIIPAVLSLRK